MRAPAPYQYIRYCIGKTSLLQKQQKDSLVRVYFDHLCIKVAKKRYVCIKRSDTTHQTILSQADSHFGLFFQIFLIYSLTIMVVQRTREITEITSED